MNRYLYVIRRFDKVTGSIQTIAWETTSDEQFLRSGELLEEGDEVTRYTVTDVSPTRRIRPSRPTWEFRSY